MADSAPDDGHSVDGPTASIPVDCVPPWTLSIHQQVRGFNVGFVVDLFSEGRREAAPSCYGAMGHLFPKQIQSSRGGRKESPPSGGVELFGPIPKSFFFILYDLNYIIYYV